DLQLLGINDFHGRLAPTATTPHVVGGAAQLAGLVDQLSVVNPHTAFVSAGDNIGASTFISAVDDDNPTLDALDAGGLDVSAVGNHELDKGYGDLRGRVAERADFPYLGANVHFADGSGRALDPYWVQLLGGIRVGYIGVVTAQTPSLVSPDGIRGLAFRDPVVEAESVAAQLRDGDPANGEADVVVLLAHEGAARSTSEATDLRNDPVFGDFTRISDDIDAVFSGHTHQAYALEVPTPGGRSRPIVQAGDYGEKLAKVTLTVDRAAKRVVGSSAELLGVTDITPVDPGVAAIVARAEADAAVLGAEPVGSVTADIEADPSRANESVAANFIADVQLEATRGPGRGGAQIALVNPGGVRADLTYAPDGTVTYAEAFAVQPFANDLVTRTYTGAQLKTALEQQWQPAGAARPRLWLGVSGGFSYDYDPAARQGRRIVASSMKLGGVTIDPAGTYRVTINSFLAAGGDNFTVLAQGIAPTTTGDNDLTVLVNHLRTHSPVTAVRRKRTRCAPFRCTLALVTSTSSTRDTGLIIKHSTFYTGRSSIPATPGELHAQGRRNRPRHHQLGRQRP
ncbi:MAG: 5-nucleotidase protein, partial [Acidimicrobiales bacterium]|nr:5-nucleotidase protein [Acidimicrobiales bacterium]